MSPGRILGRAFRRLFVLPLRPARRMDAVPAAEAVDVFTFVTDEEQYDGMLASFTAAGFDKCATFTRLTDAETEPFAAVNEIAAKPGARYALLCHQDIRFAADVTVADLFARLRELELADPAWVVAGPAGVNADLEVVRRVIDPFGGHTDHRLPVRAMSLDELFLLMNRRNSPCTTPTLRGFHFYGTDLCLRALRAGGSAWVIDVPVLHSLEKEPRSPAAEALVSEQYAAARAAFLQAWNEEFRFRYIGTTVEGLAVGRSRLAQATIGSSRVLAWVTADRDRAVNVLLGRGPAHAVAAQ
jgi:hypothetical protein